MDFYCEATNETHRHDAVPYYHQHQDDSQAETASLAENHRDRDRTTLLCRSAGLRQQ